ncbi:MAG: hypothetical protein ACRD4G_10295, partial [Bryobacteraceae bacterium]
MKRRDIFKGMLAAPLLASEAAAEPSDSEPQIELPSVNMMQRPRGAEGRSMPNILWIVADQCR